MATYRKRGQVEAVREMQEAPVINVVKASGEGEGP